MNKSQSPYHGLKHLPRPAPAHLRGFISCLLVAISIPHCSSLKAITPRLCRVLKLMPPHARNVQAPSLPLPTWLASPNPSVPAHRSPALSGLSHWVRTPVHPHTAPFVFERIRSTSLPSVWSASLPGMCALDGPRLSHPRPSAPSYAANRFLQKERIKEPLSSSSISQINALPHHGS